MRLIATVITCAVLALPGSVWAQDVNGVQYPAMLDYGIWPKSKLLEIDGHKFRAWFHPRKPFIMIQPTFTGAMEGKKFTTMDLAYWENAAQAIVEPYGCRITDVAAKTKTGATWNAQYLCPNEKIIDPNVPVSSQH